MTTTQHSPLTPAGPDDGSHGGRRDTSQTRLPWWALALPTLGFTALLTLLSCGPAAAAGSTSGTGTEVVRHFVVLLGGIVHHAL